MNVSGCFKRADFNMSAACKLELALAEQSFSELAGQVYNNAGVWPCGCKERCMFAVFVGRGGAI
jgi:hypothetical protein